MPPEVDFDRLLASLQDLSELVVEGEAQVTPVPGGAQFRTLEPIPLKLYRNGIVMFDGPFRPFYDPSTQVGWSSGSMHSRLLGHGGVSLRELALHRAHRPCPSNPRYFQNVRLMVCQPDSRLGVAWHGMT